MCVETAKWVVLRWDAPTRKIIWQCANCKEIKQTGLSEERVGGDTPMKTLDDTSVMLQIDQRRRK